MSELTKLCKEAELVSLNLQQMELSAETTGDIHFLNERLKDLKALDEKIESLLVTANKFVLKKLQRDEITGELRFGPAACGKIDSAHSFLLTSKDVCRQKVAVVLSQLAELELLQRQEVMCSTTANASETQDDLVDSVFLERQRKILEEVEESERERVRRHQLAEQSRQQRRLEAAHRSELAEKLMSACLGCFDAVNKLNVERMDTVEQILSLQKAALESASLQKMLSAVAGIVEQIVSHPDNANLRRIRVNHPQLMEKVTGQLGGVQLLAALGFELMFAAPTAAPTSENSSNSNGNTVCDQEDSTAEESHRVTSSQLQEAISSVEALQRQLLASESEKGVGLATVSVLLVAGDLLGRSLVMTMEEPPPASPQEWIRWFDRLTEMKDVLCSSLKTLH